MKKQVIHAREFVHKFASCSDAHSGLEFNNANQYSHMLIGKL